MNRLFPLGALLCAAALWSGSAHAQLLDDIEVDAEQGVARVHIGLTSPVRYVRHHPPQGGQLLTIDFQLSGVDGVRMHQRREVRTSPASDLVPCFTVTHTAEGLTQGVHEVLQLVIEFGEPVVYNVRLADDSRGFNLYIPIQAAATGEAPARRRRECPQ